MPRHAGEPGTFDAIVSGYVTGRARELVRQFDAAFGCPPDLSPLDLDEWAGHAAEILRELTRDA